VPQPTYEEGKPSPCRENAREGGSDQKNDDSRLLTINTVRRLIGMTWMHERVGKSGSGGLVFRYKRFIVLLINFADFNYRSKKRNHLFGYFPCVLLCSILLEFLGRPNMLQDVRAQVVLE
jgi:hypothetical protein